MIHGFILMGGVLDTANAAVAIAARSCAALLTKSPHEIRPEDPPRRKDPRRRARRRRA
jgi:hypothetical protein